MWHTCNRDHHGSEAASSPCGILGKLGKSKGQGSGARILGHLVFSLRGEPSASNPGCGALDPAKFQFISIDDEDQKAVEIFLTRKKMSGWVGVDTSGSVFAWMESNRGRPPLLSRETGSALS